MPTSLTPSQALLIGYIVAPALFALSVYFTQASLRRAASGLVGVIAYCVVQYTWDRVAAVTGWWSYPGYGTTGSLPMPVAIYIFSGLTFACFGLVGWRIIRRWGWKGLLTFLAAWSLWGFTLDHVGTSLFSSSRLMVISPGVVPAITDFFVYTTCMAAVLLAIRMIGGLFRADSLARTQKSAIIP